MAFFVGPMGIKVQPAVAGGTVPNEIVELILVSQNKYNETLSIMRKEKF